MPSMPQSLAAVYLHVVFSTKNRTPFLLDKDLRESIFQNLRSTAHHLGSPSLAIGGVEDHVHLLLRLSRTVSISDCVKELKRVSSLAAKGPHYKLREFSWQSGYGAFSIASTGVDAVRFYVETQEQHHKGESFKEEFLRILAEHSLEWDERYVWD